MNKFIIFLRGINVSGKNLIKMAELKQLLETNGFSNVVTYIQSGNLVLESKLEQPAVEKSIYHLIQQGFNLSVPVFVLSADALAQILNNNPFPPEAEPNKVFFTFLDKMPDETLVQELSTIDFGNETFQLMDKVLYFYVPDGMAKSKMNNNFFEKKLKVTATGRNLNTIKKMLQLSQK